MKVIVTGGCGFIGSALCRQLAADHSITVINLDALTYAADPRSLSSIENQANYKFVHGDINDTELVVRLLTEYQADAIAHLAAESHVDRSINGPEIFLKTNILGTYSLLQAARQYMDANPQNSEKFRFLHVSTDEVYGDLEEDDPTFTETTAYQPSSPYSASKAASDHLVSAWGRTFGLQVLITNCSNNYGLYQFPEKLLPLMIISAISQKDLPVYGNGRNIRDWLHVEDHARALQLVLNKGRPGETYNIGGDSERRNIDIVNSICRILDELAPREDKRSYSEQVTFVKDRPGHDHRYAINFEKIRRELGWSPEHSFERGLRDTITWYLENKEWWEPLMKRNIV